MADVRGLIVSDDFSGDVAAIAHIEAVPTILDIVCQTTGMGFAAVARVTQERWIACGVRDDIAFGLRPGGELKVETTICDEIRDSRQAVIIENVAQDTRFCGHHTPALYGFQSYISMPIVLPDGTFFGTLCAIDPQPRAINTPAIVGMFRLFADLIAFHLDARKRLAASQADLAAERHTAELREQFIAVLGHDLRNPLAAIEAGTRLVLKAEPNDKSRSVLLMMQRSVNRMSELIGHVLDLARGRLDGGLPLERHSGEVLKPTLEQVIGELRSTQPERVIAADLAFDGPVDCDHVRIGQLLSNLVANALMHGDQDAPVKVIARKQGDLFELAVVNAGAPIPPGILKDLFKPFVRASARPSQQGLGLGLYIASEIARAHGGSLDVASADHETRFIFRMPVVRPA
ncbi:MAG: GAF domain-containing sensor histidine kinase [Rhizobiales bacterium]|nr:GAF domain-containing sensor histidine kinase [Hyphomicrobiales bacterium]